MRLILALENIRSTHNVGSLLRTSLGFDLDGVVTIGITPHPRIKDDPRLPHIINRAEKQIEKTALGGEKLFTHHFEDAVALIEWATNEGLQPVSIELDKGATPIKNYVPHNDCLLIVGNEITGVSDILLNASSAILEIPISVAKGSYNVSVAGAIAIYELHAQFGKLKA